MELDREKARVYAAAGIPEYWIVSTKDSCVEAYSAPQESGYGAVRVVRRGEVLRSTSLPYLELELSQLFRDG